MFNYRVMVKLILINLYDDVLCIYYSKLKWLMIKEI